MGTSYDEPGTCIEGEMKKFAQVDGVSVQIDASPVSWAAKFMYFEFPFGSAFEE
jgi:hypothetical protein